MKNKQKYFEYAILGHAELKDEKGLLGIVTVIEVGEVQL